MLKAEEYYLTLFKIFIEQSPGAATEEELPKGSSRRFKAKFCFECFLLNFFCLVVPYHHHLFSFSFVFKMRNRASSVPSMRGHFGQSVKWVT